MATVEKAGRDKRESFKRLSKARLEQIEQVFKVLKNLGNPYNYSSTKEELNHILVRVGAGFEDLKKTYAKSMEDPVEPIAGEKNEKKGRPKKIRIPDSESTATATVAKEIAAEAKQEIAGPIITTRPAKESTPLSQEELDDVPDFLKRKSS